MGDERLRYRGRVGELKLLEDAIAGAESGRLAGVIVEGEPGIGKSRFLSEARILAQARGCQTRFGRAEELERTRPFGVMLDAFKSSTSAPDARGAAVVDLLSTTIGDRGPVTVTSDAALQFQVIDAFLDLVEERALSGPVVIGLDDLQWADPSSIFALDALTRRLPYVPVTLIAARRTAPRDERVDRLVDRLAAGGATRIALRPLSDPDVEDLVADVLGAPPGHELLAEVSGTGGNPLFVIELVRALRDAGDIQIVAGRAEVAETSLPPTLGLTILQRLSTLSGDVLDLLRHASVLGSSFALADLATVTSRSAFDLSAVLAEAFLAGVLADDGDRLCFRHDVIREALYADLSSGVRAGLHREAGHRLAAAGSPALQVAEQLVRGADNGDVAAIAWLTRAARDAAPTSPGVAADLLDRAIELKDPADEGGLAALLVERADKLLWAGRIRRAEADCRALLDLRHDEAAETAARALLGRCLMADGRMHEALPEFEAVYRSPAATDPERAASWGSASVAHVFLGQLDLAATAAKEARSAAAAADDEVTSSMALTALATVEIFRGHLDVALDLVDEGVHRADGSDRGQGHRYVHHLARGHVLIELDRFSEARATLERGMRLSEHLGARWSLAAYQFMLAVERFAAGEWDEALGAVEAGLEWGEETGEQYNLVLGHCLDSLIALHRNNRHRAEQSTAAAEEQLARGGPRYRSHWALWTRSLLLEADGRAAQAFTTLQDCWKGLTDSGMAVELPALGPDLVRMAVAAGDSALADQVTQAVHAVAGDNDVASLAAAAMRCRGLRDHDPVVLSAAAEGFAVGGRPLEEALTREDAGAAFASRGDRGAASQHYGSALILYERLAAARDVSRTLQALRTLGVRPGQRGRRARPTSGWGSITPAEQAVTDLVAEGLTNPQIGERLFISRRTVQTHLAHVFQKLQISSRTELATAITRQQRQRS